MDVENKCDHCVVLRAENERKTPPELTHSCVTEEASEVGRRDFEATQPQ